MMMMMMLIASNSRAHKGGGGKKRREVEPEYKKLDGRKRRGMLTNAFFST